MTDFTMYQLKMAVLLAVFYLLFHALLSHTTRHRFNRFALLASALLAAVLPLCVLTFHETVAVPVTAIAEVLPAIGATTAADSSLGTVVETWAMRALAAFFIAGTVVGACRLLASLWRIRRLIGTGERRRQADGTTVVLTPRTDAPLSWMRTIVLAPEDADNDIVLRHERAHSRLRHSWDLLLFDLLLLPQTLNPFARLLRRALCAVHEYEADAAVVESGIAPKPYLRLLVGRAYTGSGYSIANGFQYQSLKQRILMTTRKKDAPAVRWRALYFVPVIGLSLAATATTVTHYRPVETPSRAPETVAPQPTTATAHWPTTPTHQQPKKKQSKAQTTPTETQERGRIILQYSAQNTQYPTAAQEQGVEGTPVYKVTINARGKITKVELIKKAHPLLDAEGLRVLQKMAKEKTFPPAKNKNAAPETIIVPVTFKLRPSQETKTTSANNVSGLHEQLLRDFYTRYRLSESEVQARLQQWKDTDWEKVAREMRDRPSAYSSIDPAQLESLLKEYRKQYDSQEWKQYEQLLKKWQEHFKNVLGLDTPAG